MEYFAGNNTLDNRKQENFNINSTYCKSIKYNDIRRNLSKQLKRDQEKPNHSKKLIKLKSLLF